MSNGGRNRRPAHETPSRAEVDDLHRMVTELHRAVIGTTAKLHQDGLAGLMADAIERIANLEKASLQAAQDRRDASKWMKRTVAGALLTTFAGAAAGAIVTRVALLFG